MNRRNFFALLLGAPATALVAPAVVRGAADQFSIQFNDFNTYPSADFYISQDGNLSNPGTFAKPWPLVGLEVNQAQIHAGARIELLDLGVYRVR